MRGHPIALFASAALFAGCGGGGGGSASSAVPAPLPVTATASRAIGAAAGGAVSTAIGGETVTVSIPANALSASSTVTLIVYAQSALPRPFASTVHKPQALPASASFIIGMGLTIGTASLTKPVSFSVAGAGPVPAGNVLRLAASRQAGFADIDTATQTNGTITEVENPAYAGASLAAASILYAFYTVPAGSASPPPAVTLTVSGPATVVGGAQGKYAAAEADASGFPLLTASANFSVDSPAIGTIGPATGIFSASTANNLAGRIVGTDRRNAAITGSLPVTVLSSRPATAGDALSYGGTLVTSVANDAISSAPVVSTQTGSVTETIAVSAGSPSQAVLTANESDRFQLSTLSTKTTSTIAYQTSGASTGVRLLGSSATDSNAATYAAQYTSTSGLLTTEPEIPGTFGPNDASETYTETDPGIDVGSSGQNVTTQRATAPSGAYQETSTSASGSNTAVQNADGTGTYRFASAAAGGTVGLSFGLPTTGSKPTIPIAVTLGDTSQALSDPVWYPLPLTLYTETDSIAAANAYDPRCSVPAKYGTTSSRVTQSVSSVDAVYGNLESQTTIAYDVAGVGTVCSILTDTTQTFYDYTQQEGDVLTFGSPVLRSSVSEVLSITGGTVSGQPVSTSSARRSVLSTGHLGVVVARERFRHVVRLVKIARAIRLQKSLQRREGIR